MTLESIPWESFRLLLNKGYAQERKSSAGRQRIDPLILIEMLVLHQLFKGTTKKIPVENSDRQSQVDKDMGLMDRLSRVSNFSWCP